MKTDRFTHGRCMKCGWTTVLLKPRFRCHNCMGRELGWAEADQVWNDAKAESA